MYRENLKLLDTCKMHNTNISPSQPKFTVLILMDTSKLKSLFSRLSISGHQAADVFLCDAHTLFLSPCLRTQTAWPLLWSLSSGILIMSRLSWEWGL